jgi:hypothetical protein
MPRTALTVKPYRWLRRASGATMSAPWTSPRAKLLGAWLTGSAQKKGSPGGQ